MRFRSDPAQVTILISPNFIWKAKHPDDPLHGKEVAIMFSKDRDAIVLFGDTMRLREHWCYEWRGWHVFRLNPRQADTARSLGVPEGDWLGEIRSHRSEECGNKRRFKSEEDASRNAGQLADKSCVALRGYHCPHCDGWHLTKQIEDIDELKRARIKKGRISRER